MRQHVDKNLVIHTHDFIAPEDGADLPPHAGPLRAAGDLNDLPLVQGTVRASVSVTAERLSAPLGRAPDVGIFLDGEPLVVEPLKSGENLVAPWQEVEDTQRVTIKWRSARDVINRLEGTGRLRTIISMDIGTRRPDREEDGNP